MKTECCGHEKILPFILGGKTFSACSGCGLIIPIQSEKIELPKYKLVSSVEFPEALK